MEPSQPSPRARKPTATPEEDLSREVDRILDKMNAKQPLSDAERELLRQAGRRIGQR
jgi:hypothetical protein